MVDVKMMLLDLQEHYAASPPAAKIGRLYEREDPRVAKMFANFHERLNNHFDFANQKMDRGRHFNADDSRELHDLILEIDQRSKQLALAGIDVETAEPYAAVIQKFRSFLQLSGGTPLPDDMSKIDLIEYEPAFRVGGTTLRLEERPEPIALKMVGGGAFADVYKYKDPALGKLFAVKRVKPGASDKERARFQREYEVMRRLSFPYILEVYGLDLAKSQYTMEYCDGTLKQFYEKQNARISFDSRKRIALQFLYGLNYIHRRGLLHRDLSMNNLLVKQYDLGAVVVKLSDFGLVKEDDSDLTSKDSSMKGTLVDPNLMSFSDYSMEHEVWSVGAVLNFIFSGRGGIRANGGDIQAIVDKCTHPDPAQRYSAVAEIIAAVGSLAAPPDSTAASA